MKKGEIYEYSANGLSMDLRYTGKIKSLRRCPFTNEEITPSVIYKFIDAMGVIVEVEDYAIHSVREKDD